MLASERERIARAANQERSGPRLSAASSKNDLHRWLEQRFENWDRKYEGGYTLDDLWAEVQSAVEGTVKSPLRHGSSKMRASAGLDDVLKGWSIGYHDDISARAAVRDLKTKNGRKRLLVMTQDDHEPRDPNEPVDLGFYELDDGDNWYLVHYDSFDTPEAAVQAIRNDPETWG